jgi:Caspase domain
MAKVRLSLLSEAAQPRTAPSSAATQTAASTSAFPTGAAITGRRVALVIGNGAYVHVHALVNPSNDARSIAKSQRGIGFAVTEGIDLDRTGMQKRSAISCATRRPPRSPSSTTPATASRSKAATTSCPSTRSSRAAAASRIR